MGVWNVFRFSFAVIVLILSLIALVLCVSLIPAIQPVREDFAWLEVVIAPASLTLVVAGPM